MLRVNTRGNLLLEIRLRYKINRCELSQKMGFNSVLSPETGFKCENLTSLPVITTNSDCQKGNHRQALSLMAEQSIYGKNFNKILVNFAN